jgi:hypothetical protein
MEMLQAVVMRAFKNKQNRQKQKQAALIKVRAIDKHCSGAFLTYSYA